MNLRRRLDRLDQGGEGPFDDISDDDLESLIAIGESLVMHFPLGNAGTQTAVRATPKAIVAANNVLVLHLMRWRMSDPALPGEERAEVNDMIRAMEAGNNYRSGARGSRLLAGIREALDQLPPATHETKGAGR